MGKKILWFGKRSTLNIRAGFLTSRSHPWPLGRNWMCAFSFSICLFFIISYLFTNKRHLLLDILSKKTFCNARVRSKVTVTGGPLASWNRCIHGYQLSWVVAELSFSNLKFLEDLPSWKCLFTIEKLVLRIFACLWERLRTGKRERLKSQPLFQDSLSLGQSQESIFLSARKTRPATVSIFIVFYCCSGFTENVSLSRWQFCLMTVFHGQKISESLLVCPHSTLLCTWHCFACV